MGDRFLGARLVGSVPTTRGWVSLYAHPGGATTVAVGPLPGVADTVYPGETHEDMPHAERALRRQLTDRLHAHVAERPVAWWYGSRELRQHRDAAARRGDGDAEWMPQTVNEGPATGRGHRMAQVPRPGD
jgi:hypothetical protein